jgi:uncharacterized damage-inducible protein DinB
MPAIVFELRGMSPSHHQEVAMSDARIIPVSEFLDHWQGHRRLTRRVIERFPEDQLFTFTLGGMRSFGAMAMELLAIAAPAVRGVLTGEWNEVKHDQVVPKAELLRLWDESTTVLDELLPKIPAERFGESMMAFGQYPGTGAHILLYAIDNEIHHRGQGYVFLRALGIEPPGFYDR